MMRFVSIFLSFMIIEGKASFSFDPYTVKHATETVEKQKNKSVEQSDAQIEEIQKNIQNFKKSGNVDAAISEFERIAFLDLSDYEMLLNFSLFIAEYKNKKETIDSVSYATKKKAKDAAIFVFNQSKDPVQKAKALLLLSDLSMDNKKRYYEEAHKIYSIQKLRSEFKEYEHISTFHYKSYKMNESARTPTACFSFSKRLNRDVNYKDYIQLEPKIEAVIKTTEKSICLANLEYAKTYEVTFKKGLPNIIGESLKTDEKISLITKNEESKLAFSNDLFILLKEDEQNVPLSYTNVESVKLKLIRMSDKTFHDYIIKRNRAVFTPEDDLFYDFFKDKQIIFEGTMNLSEEKNKSGVKQIPLKKMIKELKPGIYWLEAEQERYEEDKNKKRVGQWLLITDLGLTTLKGSDGLYVQARYFSTAKAAKNITVRLVSAMSEDLAVLQSDAHGFVKFEQALLNGKNGDRPKMLIATDDKQNFVYFKLNIPAFDLTDRGVDGKKINNDLDAYIYTEQGVYRPGTTVHTNTLVKKFDATTLSKIPLFFKVLRPDGQEILVQKIDGNDLGHYEFNFDIPNAARMGQWTIQAFNDPKGAEIGSVSFVVEDFVPSRLFVKLNDVKEFITVGNEYRFNLESNYLFGLPAKQLEAEAYLMIQKQKNPFPQLKGYIFGNQDEVFESKRIDLDNKKLDESGRGTFKFGLEDDKNTKSTFPLEVEINGSVLEESGRKRFAKQRSILQTERIYVGTKTQRYHPNGIKEIPVDVLTVDYNGVPREEKLTFDIFEEETYYIWQNVNGKWNYSAQKEEKFFDKGSIQTDKDGKATFHINNDGYKEYKGVLKNENDDIVATFKTEVGFKSNNTSHQSPDQLNLKIDRDVYDEGDTILLKVSAPFDGELLLTLASNVVYSNQNYKIKKGENLFEIKANKEWGNGVYILATAMRPLVNLSKQPTEEQLLPKRAIGVQWVKMNTMDQKLDVKIEAIEETRPKKSVHVRFKIEGHIDDNTYLTFSAVDEGILFLCDFITPDPYKYFFQKNLLSVELRDLYAKIINPLKGDVGELKSGGDGATLSRNLSSIAKRTFKLVSLYHKPIKVEKDGTASINLDIPEFNGTLRLMAVAFNKKATGFGVKTMLVKEPVVIEPLLPRFLHVGDRAHIALSLHNTSEEINDFNLSLKTNGPIEVDKKEQSITMDKDLTIPLDLKGTGLGDASLTVTLKGDKIDPIEQTIEISVLPKGNKAMAQHIALVNKGEDFKVLKEWLDEFEENGLTRTLTTSFTVPWDLKNVAKSLKEYPFSCTEQTASKGIAFTYLKDKAGIFDTLSTLSQRQKGDGGFSIWTFDQESPQLSAMVFEFLKMHEENAPLMYKKTKEYLKSVINGYRIPNSAKAFAIYVLGDDVDPGEVRVFFDNNFKNMQTPYEKALLINMCARISDKDRVKKAKDHFDAQGTVNETFVFRSQLADHLYILKALKEAAEYMPDEDFSKQIQRYAILGNINAKNLSTQEAAAILSLYSTSDEKPEGLEDVQKITNTSDDPKWYSLTIEGNQKEAKEDTFKGITVKRSYYNTKGEIIKSFKRGYLVVIHLQATIHSPLTPGGEVVFVDRLPSCFEHEKYQLDLKEGLPWCQSSNENAIMKKDDRFIATFESDGIKTMNIAYVVRVTYSGDYECPSFEALDMFNPSIFGKTAHSQLTIEEKR